MKHDRAVWTSIAVSVVLSLSGLASGQQGTPLQWQGPLPSSSVWQSSAPAPASQQRLPETTQRLPSPHPQSPPATLEQSSGPGKQQPLPVQGQGPYHPNVQEIPAVWQAPAPTPPQSAPSMSPPTILPLTSVPGYVGLHGRDFYRARFCMHALTIQGVEVMQIEPNSPAARAGLRPAQPLTTREIAIGAAAGVLSVAQAEPVAAALVNAGGGMNHGDIILAVAGRRVKTFDEFQHELAQFGPQAVVYFTVRRGESVLQLPVRLAHEPTSDASGSAQEASATGTP
jgi:hypothetical protein